MSHEVLHAALSAQQANAVLSGCELRTAAENLVRIASGRTRLKALDAAGERIIGATLMLSESLETWNYATAFPTAHACLLVGGVVAGPVSIAAAAEAALAAGASRVDVAIVSGWTAHIAGVTHIREIGATPVQVA